MLPYQTARCIVDLFDAENEALNIALLDILHHPKFADFMGLGPHNPDGNKAYLHTIAAMNKADGPTKGFSILYEGRLAGMIDCAIIDGGLDIGYFLHPDAQGKGLMKECLPPVIGWVFTHPAVDEIVATTHPENYASMKMLAHNGFVQTGTKARQYDNHSESTTWSLTKMRYLSLKASPSPLTPKI